MHSPAWTCAGCLHERCLSRRRLAQVNAPSQRARLLDQVPQLGSAAVGPRVAADPSCLRPLDTVAGVHRALPTLLAIRACADTHSQGQQQEKETDEADEKTEAQNQEQKHQRNQ